MKFSLGQKVTDFMPFTNGFVVKKFGPVSALRKTATTAALGSMLIAIAACGGGGANSGIATTPNTGPTGGLNVPPNQGPPLKPTQLSAGNITGTVYGQTFNVSTAFVVSRKGWEILVLTNQVVPPCRQFRVRPGGVSVNVYLSQTSNPNFDDPQSGDAPPLVNLGQEQTEENWQPLSAQSIHIQGVEGRSLAGSLQLSDNQGGVLQGSFTAFICN